MGWVDTAKKIYTKKISHNYYHYCITNEIADIYNEKADIYIENYTNKMKNIPYITNSHLLQPTLVFFKGNMKHI